MEFISDRVSCIKLKGQWSDIIVLNVHAPSEDKEDDTRVASKVMETIFFLVNRRKYGKSKICI